MRRFCNARTRRRGRCRNPSSPGCTRCYKHGAGGGRPKGIPLAPEHTAAIVGGRRRWVERMREAKARGEIERFPGGRRARGLPPLSKDRTIRRAQRILEARGSNRGAVMVPATSDATKAEKLGEATDISLDRVLAFLYLDVDPRAEPKLFALQMNTAMTTISNQVRVDTAELTARALSPTGLTEEQRRAQARQAILEAFAERPQLDNSISDSDAGS